MLDEKYVIRFCVNAPNASDDDMRQAWELIRVAADSIQVAPAAAAPPPTTPGSTSPCMNRQASQEAACANQSNPDSSIDEGEASGGGISSRMKRLRFGISKMVSEPEFIGTKYHTSPKNQYKRLVFGAFIWGVCDCKRLNCFISNAL